MATRPDLFPNEALLKDNFVLAYAQVYTRAFGGYRSFPEPFLAPFADMFNHNHLNIAHYIINKKMHLKAIDQEQTSGT